MHHYFVTFCLFLGLLSACQPADPAPAGCGQPQADQASYLWGRYIDPSFSLTPDSVACFSVGQESSVAGSGGFRQNGAIKMWFVGAEFRLENNHLPGTSRDQMPKLGFSFVLVPSSGQPGVPVEQPDGLRVGRYGWGNSLVRMNDRTSLRAGVEVWLQRFRQQGTLSDSWVSGVAAQDPESYFEITRLDPHPGNEKQIIVTGCFTVRLFGWADPWTQARQSILLRNVQFRANIDRPELAYR